MKRLSQVILLLAALGWCVPARAGCPASFGNGAACVQATNVQNAGSGTTASVTLSGVSASDTLIVGVWFCGNNAGTCNVSTATITNALTNTAGSATCTASNHSPYSTTTPAAYQSTIYIYLCTGLSAGTQTLKATTSATTFFLALSVSEWSGVPGPFDGANVDASGAGSTSNPSIATSATTTNATDLVYAMVNSASTAATAGSGYTAILATINADEGKTVAATGTQTATWTNTAQSWFGAVAPIKLAAAAGTGGGLDKRRRYEVLEGE